jgi:hypothetical protein
MGAHALSLSLSLPQGQIFHGRLHTISREKINTQIYKKEYNIFISYHNIG